MASRDEITAAEAQRTARLRAEGKDTEAWTSQRAAREQLGNIANGLRSGARSIGNALNDGLPGSARAPGGWNFTPGFYDDLDKMVNGMSPNQWSSLANTHAAMATDYSNQAARRNMEAQAHQRQANYNPFTRAGEIAAAQDEDTNRRKMQSGNFTAGTGGVLNRTTTDMDVKTQQNIANEERSKADQSRQQADQFTRDATMHMGASDKARVDSADYRRDRDEAYRRSMGEGTVQDKKSKTSVYEERTKKDTDDGTGDDDTTTTPEIAPGNMQAALNYITYGNDPTSGWSNGTKENYEEGKKTAEYFGLSPITTKTYYEDTGSMQPIVNGLMSGNPNWKHFGDVYNKTTGRNVDFTSTGNINFNKQANVGVGGYTQAQLQKDSEVEDLTGM
jgi:hypothetical protein